MPGFQVHITGSTVIGVGYGAAAWYWGGMPPTTCVLAGGLCSVAGMFPDLDSGPGIPLKESVAFGAAVVPMMMIHRFHQWQLPLEMMIIAGAAIYLAIRFGVTWLLKNHAHHRGMFHSLPAAAIAGQATFLAFWAEDPLKRYFVASAVVLGFLSHLVLDEIWSVNLGMFGPKFKKSFGTALKFYGPVVWPNLLTWGMAVILGGIAASDAAFTEGQAEYLKRFGHAQGTFQNQFERVRTALPTLPSYPYPQHHQPQYQPGYAYPNQPPQAGYPPYPYPQPQYRR